MFVARLFAWLDRVLGSSSSAAGSGIVSHGPRRPRVVPGSERSAPPLAALLSVDGAGQVLVTAAQSLSLGHLRAGRADLGFLADVGGLHARLTRCDSFQLGPGWTLTPLQSERVMVDGNPLAAEGRRISGGERVRLGENLELELQYPDPASASAVLELLRGQECLGARRVLLLAPGRGGRARIGASRAHHVCVPGLEFEVALEWDGSALHLRSDVPFEGVPAGETPALPLPLRSRVTFDAGKPRGSRPPFALTLEPLPWP